MVRGWFSIVLGAALLSACNGGAGTSGGPGAAPPQNATIQNPSQGGTTRSESTTGASLIVATGKISAVSSDGFTIAGTDDTNTIVDVKKSTPEYGAGIAVGHYAVAVGTVSTSGALAPVEVGTSKTAIGTITDSGTVSRLNDGGFTMKSASGYIDVWVLPSTDVSGSIGVGDKAEVTGVGTTSTMIAASKLTMGSSTTSSSQTHILTADYLGAQSKFTWTAAAPYLTWASTDVSDSAAVHAAGIKTMVYVNPNRTIPDDELYDIASTGDFAHACSGSRITADLYANDAASAEYVMNIEAASMQELFAKYVKSLGGTFDAVYEDDAGPLTDYSVYHPFSALPCGYTNAAWIAGGEALDNASPIPVIFSGLGGSVVSGTPPVSPSVALLASTNTIGANMEGCYASPDSAKLDGWYWTIIENTELVVTEKNKLFECMNDYAGAAASNTDSRLFAFASFLLTYNPQTSILWETYATTSALHVMPESGLVATDPKVTTPASIAGLLQSGGTYAREYEKCYLRGSYVGPCAVVVNPDAVSHPFPFSGYEHTLALSGSGLLDGGKVSVDGPAPPSTVEAAKGIVAFP